MILNDVQFILTLICFIYDVRFAYNSNKSGVTRGTGTANNSFAHECIPAF